MAMFGFLKKRKKPRETASTFVEATGGGWGDSPDVIGMPSGTEGDCVAEVLRRAKDYAITDNVAVGQKFEFRITDIPMGIESPHTIIFGLMMQAADYGLRVGVVYDETVQFTRVA